MTGGEGVDVVIDVRPSFLRCSLALLLDSGECADPARRTPLILFHLGTHSQFVHDLTSSCCCCVLDRRRIDDHAVARGGEIRRMGADGWGHQVRPIDLFLSIHLYCTPFFSRSLSARCLYARTSHPPPSSLLSVLVPSSYIPPRRFMTFHFAFHEPRTTPPTRQLANSPESKRRSTPPQTSPPCHSRSSRRTYV